jgi:hypothetical protein
LTFIDRETDTDSLLRVEWCETVPLLWLPGRSRIASILRGLDDSNATGLVAVQQSAPVGVAEDGVQFGAPFLAFQTYLVACPTTLHLHQRVSRRVAG